MNIIQTRRNRDRETQRLPAIVLCVWTLGGIAAAQDAKIEFQLLPPVHNLGVPDRHANFVIRSTQDWYRWVDNLTGVVDDLPSVDFERYILLIASAGYKPHGPVVVTFDSITDTANAILVHISVTNPATCPRDPESGRYVAMAQIRRTDKPIQFDVSNTDRGCLNP